MVPRIQKICNEGVTIRELSSASRSRLVSETRRIIACRLVRDYGITLSEIARDVGVSTYAVSEMMGIGSVHFNKLRNVP
jgi:hypothetical protein